MSMLDHVGTSAKVSYFHALPTMSFRSLDCTKNRTDTLSVAAGLL